VVFVLYKTFAKILKYEALVLLIFIATAFVARMSLRKVIIGSLIRTIRLSGDYGVSA
jgi:hypothetical protein